MAPPPGGKVGLLAPPPADAATHHVFTGTTASVASHHATAAPAATSTTSSNDWGDLDGFGSMSFASAPAAAKKSDGFGRYCVKQITIMCCNIKNNVCLVVFFLLATHLVHQVILLLRILSLNSRLQVNARMLVPVIPLIC